MEVWETEAPHGCWCNTVHGTLGGALGAGADLSGFLPLSALTACLPHSGLIS